MKIDTRKFVKVRAIVSHYGKEIFENLPKIHVLTGCDTSSFLHGVGKVKILKNLKDNPENIQLLANLGRSVHSQKSEVEEDLIQDVAKFIQCVCYTGKEEESLVETIIRIYRKMKVKSSQTLPPVPQSMAQHILRVNLQVFEWIRCTEMIIPDADFPWQCLEI